ncbi:MAG: DUF362 domain-containing protein [bacterium]|nr:DUF362 domain-containing protein [bacterium]
MSNKRITRRRFAKTLLSGTAGLGVSMALPGMFYLPGKQSPVVVARSPKLMRVKNQVKKTDAAFFLDRAITEITSAGSPASAWKSLFSPGEKVGVKLSCLPGPALSSGKGIVMAIIHGLLSAGVKRENIFIWERTDRELQRAGFNITQSGINIIGTDHYRDGGYSRDIKLAGQVGSCFSRIIETVDALISVPVLKDHDIAGVSISMKNFYGAIHNPNKYHGNNCDPYVADLCSHPFIKNKLRLTVCDASRVQVHNGPAFFQRYAWEYGGMLVSCDPVALDYTGWQIIEERRKMLKMKSLKEEKREPTYIKTAAKLKLGNADPQLIRRIEI